MCFFKKKKKKETNVIQKDLPVIVLEGKEPFIIARSKAKLECGPSMVNNYTAIVEPDGDGYYLVVRTGEITVKWGKNWEGCFKANGTLTFFRRHENDQAYNDRVPYDWREVTQNGQKIAYLYESIYDLEKENRYIGFGHYISEHILNEYLKNIDCEKIKNENDLKVALDTIKANPEFQQKMERLGLDKNQIKFDIKRFEKISK